MASTENCAMLIIGLNKGLEVENWRLLLAVKVRHVLPWRIFLSMRLMPRL